MAFSGDNPDSDFRRLAKELRARQAIISSKRSPVVNRSSKEDAGAARIIAAACSISPVTTVEKLAVGSTSTGAYDELGTATKLPLGQSSVHALHRQELQCHLRRRIIKNEMVSRRSVCSRSTTAIRRPGRQKDASSYSSDGDGMASSISLEKLDSRVGAATNMLGMFESGVSAATIRRLYRRKRRDDEQKKENERALQEERRSYRAKRSERVSLWEEVSRALLLARQGNYGDSACGEASENRAPWGCESGALPETDTYPAATVGTEGGALASVAVAGSPVFQLDKCLVEKRSPLQMRKVLHVKEEEQEDEDDRACCCILGELDWKHALHDDCHAAELSRDIKRELRAGRTVSIRALRGQTPEATSSLEDCRLALKVLYMRCVQCCADPALPPILPGEDGCVSLTMEPSKRYKRLPPGSSSSSSGGNGHASHSTSERVKGGPERSVSHYLPPITWRTCSC